MTPLIARILPVGVAAAEIYGDVLDTDLFPSEEVVVANAVTGRRRAFTSGRACARRAMRGLGLDPVAVPAGERGMPRWPDAVVGSVTHSNGYRAAAVAWARDFASIGIDAEPAHDLSERLVNRIAGPNERASLSDLHASQPAIPWRRLLFSAKEAVYKAWYPLSGRWLAATDIEIGLDAAQGRFRVTRLACIDIACRCEPSSFVGSWLTEGGLLLTTAVVEAEGNGVKLAGTRESTFTS